MLASSQQTHSRSKYVVVSTMSQLDAEEAAALAAIEHMETQEHIQLRDYNYSRKENLVDAGRRLLAKTKGQTKAIKRIDTQWRQMLEELVTALETCLENTTTPFYHNSEVTNEPGVRYVLQQIATIEDELAKVIDDAKSVLEEYGVYTSDIPTS
uniref:Uncharacterized protein n=1 Tax=Arundo donax TaxID=35708 RepID=A0A0A9AJ43_ARUDO